MPSPAEAIELGYDFYYISGYGGDAPVWADNGVICNFESCRKATSENKAAESKAYLVLVSKNGDAPKTFKTLENEKQLACDPSGAEFEKKCSLGHHWGCNKSTGEWGCIPD